MEILTYCFNLTELSLSLKSNIKDFNPSILETISHLTKLEKLALIDFGITDDHIKAVGGGKDIALFERLKNLKSLDLKGNAITDISSLSSIPNKDKIIELNLSSQNKKSTTGSTVGSTTGSTVDSSSKLEKLGDISLFSSLETLDISYNSISDLSPLKHLKKLKTVKLSNNNVYDLTPVSHVSTVEAASQTVIMEYPVSITKGKIDSGLLAKDESGAFIRNITKDKSGKSVKIDDSEIINPTNGANNVKGVVDSDNNIKWKASDLGFKENGNSGNHQAKIKYSFNNDDKFSGTVTHIIRENQKPTIELDKENQTDTLTVIKGEKNVTINLGKKVVNTIKVVLKDTEYDQEQEGKSLSTTTTDKPKIKSVKSGDMTLNHNNEKEFFEDIKKIVENKQNGEKITLTYEVVDGYGLTNEVTIDLYVKTNDAPNVTVNTTGATVTDGLKYSDGTKKYDLSQMPDYDASKTFQISPRDIKNIVGESNNPALKKDEDVASLIFSTQKFVNVSDDDESFDISSDNVVDGFKDGKIDITIIGKIIDGNLQTQNKEKNIERPKRNTINLYEITCRITDSNGAEVEDKFSLVVTNQAPKIDGDYAEELKYTKSNSTITIPKDVLTTGMYAKDLEDTSDEDISIDELSSVGMELQKLEVKREDGKSVKINQPKNPFKGIFNSIFKKTTESTVDSINITNLPIGNHEILYTVKDSDGNSANYSRALIISHPEEPLVNVKDDSDILLNPRQVENFNANSLYQEYKERIEVTDDKIDTTNGLNGIELTEKYYQGQKEVELEVPPSKDNTEYKYDMEIIAKDKDGKEGYSNKKIRVVVSNKTPEVKIDKNVIYINEGEILDISKQVSAFDAEDKDLTNKIEVFMDGEKKTNIDTSTLKVGEYDLEYRATDLDGNVGKAFATIIVKGASDSLVDFDDKFEDMLTETGELRLSITQAKEYTKDKFKSLVKGAPSGYKFKEIRIIQGANNNLDSLITDVPKGEKLTHKVQFIYTNPSGGFEILKELIVTVTNSLPVISLEDGIKHTITTTEKRDVAFKEGISANDDEDGNLTKKVTYKILYMDGKETGVTNSGDLKPGVYNVEYTVKDNDGNEGKFSRVLNVTEGENSGNNNGSNNGNNNGINNGNNNTTNKPEQKPEQKPEEKPTTKPNGGDHPNTIFKNMYDLTGDKSLSLSEARKFKSNPLKDVEIVQNDMGITISDIEVVGMEKFNPDEDLKGEERVKDYIITYKVKGYEKVAKEDINLFSLLLGNISLRNGVLVAANDTLELSVDRKVTVTNEKPEVLGSKDATVEKSAKVDALKGVEAQDTEDGDLTKNIKVSPDPTTIKTDNVGDKFTLSYTVEDSDGNFAEPLERTFEVVEANANNNGQNNNQSSGQNNQNGQNNSQSNENNATTSEQGKNPETGDTSILGISALAVLSGIGLLVVNRKKD